MALHIGNRLLATAALLLPLLASGQPAAGSGAGTATSAGTAASAGAVAGAGAVIAPAEVKVVGDAVPAALTALAGDPARGRAIVTDRQLGLCLLCHSGPFPEQRFQGNLAPSLAGAGARQSVAQLRLRIVDSSRVNAGTIMPSYYRLEGLQRVGPAWQGKTILTAQQIEDVVAYLSTLRD